MRNLTLATLVLSFGLTACLDLSDLGIELEEDTECADTGDCEEIDDQEHEDEEYEDEDEEYEDEDEEYEDEDEEYEDEDEEYEDEDEEYEDED